MLNLGIVGLGKWGRRHVDSAIASGRFRVARAVTGRPDKGAEFAAGRAIAACVSPVELTAEYIIPSVFNKKVAPAVARAVGRAAQQIGVPRPWRRLEIFAHF